MGVTEFQRVDTALELASIAAVVANACDHAEHNEVWRLDDVRDAARRLRSIAASSAGHAGQEPIELYATRLDAIERRNVLHHDHAFDGGSAARGARTLRELQLVQARHDHHYHLDVVGLAKADQLRHYALHLAKLAGVAADVAAGRADEDDFVRRRVADALLFGIKLSTVTGERLGDEPIAMPDHAAARSLSV